MRVLQLSLLLTCTTLISAQSVQMFDTYDEFLNNVVGDESKIYVVNFWATWCAPCVKELSYFDELSVEISDNHAEVVLVSVDFKKDHDRRLLPLIVMKEIKSRVVHLTDPDANSWIDKIDPSWDGSIPATLFLKGSKRLFVSHEYPDVESLKNQYYSFIN